jgi:glycine amidinotransferase
MPRQHWNWFKQNGGKPFPSELLRAAADELDELARVLEQEGVVVRRPDLVDWSVPFQTPDFGTTRGLYGAMPRDLLLVVGDEIIEAPMAWRSRYFESRAYRTLLKDYFSRGARWSSAPRPQLSDASYFIDPDDKDYDLTAGRSVITDHEPLFDAADFCRIGKDIFGQISQVTNRFGIAWLARHLGPTYRVHILDFHDPKAMHIDASFVPLGPGRLMVNPERVRSLPSMFQSWEVLHPPEPTVPDTHPFYFSSRWLSLNVLSLDEKRVVVEAEEEPLIAFLSRCGFQPIPVRLRNFGSLGGGFHCATSDIRRRSGLASYF